MPYADRKRQREYQRDWVRRKRAEKVRHIAVSNPKRGAISFFPNKQRTRPAPISSLGRQQAAEIRQLKNKIEALEAILQDAISRIREPIATYEVA